MNQQRCGRKVNQLTQDPEPGETQPDQHPTDQHPAEQHSYFNMYKIGLPRGSAIMIDVEINKHPVQMELDTGASVSVMSKDFLEENLGKDIEITPSKIYLRTYTGEIIEPVGLANVTVSYRGQTKKLPIIITPNDGPTLMGRNWLHDITLDWKKLFTSNSIYSVKSSENLDNLLAEFEEVFRPELGMLKDTVINIPVTPGTKPRFFRARGPLCT